MNAQSSASMAPAALATDMGATTVVKARPKSRRRLLMLSLPVALVVGAGA